MSDYKTRLYRIWQKMKARCYNPNQEGYERYGGRGIKVCDEWLNNFSAFKLWALTNNYADNLSIDRIDFNGNYEPSNCRWADSVTQANNTSRNHYITYNGQTKTLVQWADYLGINRNTLHVRLDIRGWSVERAFNTKPKPITHYTSKEERSKAYKNKKREYYLKNKDVLKEKRLAYYKNNKEKILEQIKEYRSSHREEYKHRLKIYKASHRDEIKMKGKMYRESHAEDLKQYKKEWYNNKKEMIKRERDILCNDPRCNGKICSFQALKLFASRHKDSPLVNYTPPTEWAKQFIIK